MFGLGVKEHPTLPAWRDGFDTRRPNQSECGVTVAHGPSKPRGTGSYPVIRSTPSVVSMQHSGFLPREVVVRVHPEGPEDHVAQAAEATGREPVQWRFESAHGHHLGSWRNRQTRHAQSVQIGVRIPASRPYWRGHSRRESRRVVSAEARVRVPLSPPEWARRSTGGSLARTQPMRVRFPPSPPSDPCRGGKGRRPWRSHKPHHAGSIPASATSRRFVQWKDSGPTNRRRGFDSLTGYQSRW